MNYPLHPSLFDDWHLFFKDYGPSVIALITAVIAGFITWYWQSRQNEVAREVRDIAARQSTNAQTKLRLELFQERFAAYQKVVECINFFEEYGSQTTEKAQKFALNELRKATLPIRYLFNNEIFNLLDNDIRKAIGVYMSSHDAYFNTNEESDDNGKRRDLYLASGDAFSFLTDQLDLSVRPYLKIEQLEK